MNLECELKRIDDHINQLVKECSSLTNRMVHEEAAGIGLDNSFFATSGIDPDAEYEPEHTRHCAYRLAFGDGECECGGKQ